MVALFRGSEGRVGIQLNNKTIFFFNFPIPILIFLTSSVPAYNFWQSYDLVSLHWRLIIQLTLFDF